MDEFVKAFVDAITRSALGGELTAAEHGGAQQRPDYTPGMGHPARGDDGRRNGTAHPQRLWRLSSSRILPTRRSETGDSRTVQTHQEGPFLL